MQVEEARAQARSWTALALQSKDEEVIESTLQEVRLLNLFFNDCEISKCKTKLLVALQDFDLP